jgi:hypothetical protein
MLVCETQRFLAEFRGCPFDPGLIFAPYAQKNPDCDFSRSRDFPVSTIAD